MSQLAKNLKKGTNQAKTGWLVGFLPQFFIAKIWLIIWFD